MTRRVRLLPAADRIATPWKNGGGTTTEVAIHPEGAKLDAFGFRISIASVAIAGPFSTFPGVDRLLAVIDGAGMDLDVEGARVHLGRRDAPYAFRGEARVDATLPDGPTVDLNVMVKRGAYTAKATRWGVSAALPTLSVDVTTRGTAFVVALSGEVTATFDGVAIRPGPRDAIRCDGGGGEVRGAVGAEVIVVEIEPA